MRIGFIGLGAMGRGMAANLQRAGHELVVHDLYEESAREFVRNGATWASTPRELALETELVFTSLPTPKDVETVGDAMASGLRPGSTWFDLTTNSVAVVRRLHARMAEQGVEFLDAPVSGGAVGAASGKMSLWVGGTRSAFDRYEPVLQDMSDGVRYIGAIGAGSITKLTHNMASLAFNTVISEVLTMGVKAGVDPADLWEAVRDGGVGRQRCFDNVGKSFLQSRFDPPLFELRLAFKDAQLALELAREAEVPMKLCNLVGLEMSEAMNRGWGKRDSQCYLALQQERAGVPPFALTQEQVDQILED
jgi:3-hydroxyisobutyrate dehydrogenase